MQAKEPYLPSSLSKAQLESLLPSVYHWVIEKKISLLTRELEGWEESQQQK